MSSSVLRIVLTGMVAWPGCAVQCNSDSTHASFSPVGNRCHTIWEPVPHNMGTGAARGPMDRPLHTAQQESEHEEDQRVQAKQRSEQVVGGHRQILQE